MPGAKTSSLTRELNIRPAALRCARQKDRPVCEKRDRRGARGRRLGCGQGLPRVRWRALCPCAFWSGLPHSHKDVRLSSPLSNCSAPRQPAGWVSWMQAARRRSQEGFESSASGHRTDSRHQGQGAGFMREAGFSKQARARQARRRSEAYGEQLWV
ncbi:hypothetical protein F5X68DRAFT_38951 [Plectosphaerella plurivora]|uniref:Uncharacterized protein n=1 Tax=Plectosphaerella plurivora TaxID=936078 RepID=A0A9P8V4R4_9PEZI|nr:hypothetical protein F5X68DRAFT_38951 [Plectosphaerella plurivora]